MVLALNQCNQSQTVDLRGLALNCCKAKPYIYVVGSESVIKQLYYAFFHPQLLYGLIIWGVTFKSYLNPLQILQNKALKAISDMQK